MPQAFYRRQLPHLQIDNRQPFVTFCTDHRWTLPERVRSIVLDCCLYDNGEKFDLRVAVVMPDHVHMIFTPLVDEEALEVYSLGAIMDAVKGASAHKVNKCLAEKVGYGSRNLLIMCCVLRRAWMRRFNTFWKTLCATAWLTRGLTIGGYGRRTSRIRSLLL